MMRLADLLRWIERPLYRVLPRGPLLAAERAYFRRAGEAELALLPLLVRPDGDAVDIGGHEGCYSLFLIGLARRVHIFEPIPWMAAQLRRKFGPLLTVHELALSDRAGQATLAFPRRNDDGAATAKASLSVAAGAAHATVTVRTATLDDLALDRVGFIKIDVEGHEEEVLRGAAATIARCRPRLLIEIEECHRAGGLARIRAWFAERGYGCFLFEDGRLQPLGTRQAADLQPADWRRAGLAYFQNFIFLPDDDVIAGQAQG
jgi:FkbM family methyltransferase